MSSLFGAEEGEVCVTFEQFAANDEKRAAVKRQVVVSADGRLDVRSRRFRPGFRRLRGFAPDGAL